LQGIKDLTDWCPEYSGAIRGSRFSACAQVIDLGRGEGTRTLDPLHPMQGRGPWNF
jgi:hypothetical protein